MSRTPRIVALAVALVLPAGAVAVLLFTDPEPPRPPSTTAAPASGPDTAELVSDATERLLRLVLVGVALAAA